MSAPFHGYDNATLAQLQNVELEILLAIDKVCRENNITYFLDSGTALGAVRHHGFIPWDDDSDIGMLRPDFERFMTIAQDALGDEFVVSSARKNSSHAYQFGQVWKANTVFLTQESMDAGNEPGIYVDVFPFDVLNKDPKTARRQIRMGSLWQKISYLYHSPHVRLPFKGIAKGLFRALCFSAHYVLKLFVNQRMIIKHFDKAMKLGLQNPSENYVGLCYPLEHSFPKDMLVPTRDIDFENHQLSVPNKTEAFLEIEFGPNWRKLPPLEERKNHAPLILKFDAERDE